MSAAGADNGDANSNNVIFTIRGTKLYVIAVTLSAKDNQKLSKLLGKGFGKSENKNATNEYRYFLESKLVGVNWLLVLVHSNQDNNSKRYKAKRYYFPKGFIKN